MNRTHILALAMAGLMTTPAFAQEADTPGAQLEYINMLTPEEGDPAYKISANEKYGTQWAVDMAYGYWHSKNTRSDYNNNAHLALFYALLNQRIIEDSVNGGTWIRAEFCGTWGLDHRSAKSDSFFTDGFGTYSYVHSDAMGAHDGALTELTLMHYFAGKRACIIGGMVNLTNYFDTVGIANDSYSSFVNDGFVNSSVLGLTCANAGAILQVELDPKSYGMLGFSRTDARTGYNPFTDGGSGYMLIGEYGRNIWDDAATIRLTPFYRQIDEEGTKHSNFGLAASIEYTICDDLTVYARSGYAFKEQFGASFDFSCGANVRLCPTREDDFLGVAVGVIEAQEPCDNEREIIAEAMYSFQLNDYFKIIPHVQYIAQPAYDPESSEEIIVGVQGVFSF